MAEMVFLLVKIEMATFKCHQKLSLSALTYPVTLQMLPIIHKLFPSPKATKIRANLI